MFQSFASIFAVDSIIDQFGDDLSDLDTDPFEFPFGLAGLSGSLLGPKNQQTGAALLGGLLPGRRFFGLA